MKSRVRIAGHAVHPMLIVFPLGLLSISFAFDLIGLATKTAVWGVVAYWNVAAGVILGVVAGVIGLLDLTAIPPGTRASRVGIAHGIANLSGLACFAISLAARTASEEALPGPVAVAFSGAGVALALVGGWLGGELVERLGVGIDDGASLDG